MKPDYRNSIVNLSVSLAAGFGATPGRYPPLTSLPPASVAAAGHVVLLIVDGLGYDYVRAAGGPLADHLTAPLTSVFPSSTAPAITSLMTATAPQQHAVTGWWMLLRELGAVALLLPFRLRCGAGLDGTGWTPADLIGARSVFDRVDGAGYALLPDDLADSGYSRATSGGARRLGFRSLAELPGAVAGIVDAAAGRSLTIVYWPQFDALSHARGVAAEAVKSHYHELSLTFDELCRRLRGRDALVVVSADHGFIDGGSDRVVDLADHPALLECLALPLTGEPRAAFCHLRPDSGGRFEQYVNEVLGPRVDCRRGGDLIRDGWFGLGEPDPRLRQRVGDYVLIGRDNYVVHERLGAEPPWTLIGVHGGVSEAEMRVPLVVAYCR